MVQKCCLQGQLRHRDNVAPGFFRVASRQDRPAETNSLRAAIALLHKGSARESALPLCFSSYLKETSKFLLTTYTVCHTVCAIHCMKNSTPAIDPEVFENLKLELRR